MRLAYPSPVLSMASDVVRDLDEYEALPGLWMLFTKCKGSLKDGRRLENISWRLWHLEMMSASLERYECPLNYDSAKRAIKGWNKAYRPPTPVEAVQAVAVSEPSHLSTSQPPHPPDLLISTLHPRLPAKSIPARRRSSASSRKTRRIRTGVGRIICDLLPNSLPAEVLRHQPGGHPASALQSLFTAMTAQEPGHIKCDIPVVKDIKGSSLPTPSTEENEPPAPPHVTSEILSHDASELTPVELSRAQDPSTPEVPALTILDASDPPAPVISAPNLIHTSPGPSPKNPDLSLATTIATPNALTLPPPRLIVVNPTPNPTPHPTPPATPVLQNTSPHAAGNTIVPFGNQHLLPPPAFHVVPVQRVEVSPQRRLTMQNDNLAVEATQKREQLLPSAAKTEPPRIPGEDVQVHVPPSPTLTDEAIVPPQSEKNLDFLDQSRLHHPLTVLTKVEPVTTKPSRLKLVPSSPSVVAHIFGGPTYMVAATTRSASLSPTNGDAKEAQKELPLVTSPTAESEKATLPRPGPGRRQNSVGVKASSSGPKKLPRTNSTGNVVTLNNAGGTHTRTASRSRSRDGSGPGLGLGAGGLVMTRAASTGPAVKSKAKVVGSKAVAARLGARKIADKSKERSKSKEKEKGVEDEHDKDGLKRPTFNIGSNSDEGSGMGSKSVGSGSEMSGAVLNPNAARVNEQVAQVMVQEKAKDEEGATESRQRPAKVQVAMDDKTIVGAQALLEALLPQQQKRIVVASSDSEDEFETDDGSWSSEEMSGDEPELAKSGGSNGTKQKHQPPIQQQRLPAAPVVHAQVDEPVKLKHLPTNPQLPSAYHNDKRNHPGRLSRRQLLLNQAKAHTQSIEQAALEAQRQREMFAKIPTGDNIARTRSVGLLTQLMNPDPHIFHPNHPYRRGFSSGEVRGQQQGHLGQEQFRIPGGPMTGVSNNVQANSSRTQQALQGPRPLQAKVVPPAAPPVAAPPVAPIPEVRRPAPARQPSRQYTAPNFNTNKVSAAMPVASQVQVGSLRPNSGGETGALKSQVGLDLNPRVQANVRPTGGYRPRGRPEDAELEEESGTEEESGIQVSKSVAQEKLRALAERRGIRPNRRASTDDTNAQPLPAWAEHPMQQHQYPAKPPGPVRMHTTPTPIPQALTHPYNLPLTALPTTPRTTRRHMLQTEMSESLRRNLLWERQVSKNNMLGFRRTASSGGGARGNVLNSLRPLATNDPMPAPPNMVHLTAKGSKNNINNPNPNPNQAGDAVQESSRAFARNRSWAGEEDDYHRKGW